MRNLGRFRAALALLLLPLLLMFAGCEEIDSQPLDADLVVEQYITENNDMTGMVYSSCTMHWQAGKLQTMRFTQRFITPEKASVAYQGRVSELGEAGQVLLDGYEVSYYVNIEPWEDKSYATMYEAMNKDKKWQVVEDKSGEYLPDDVAGE
ncbi:MAG TPA: hypothetical protein IAB00_03650 [Candidatus Avidehalobacter gallistercoris]|uniref:Lipoprotein n=1 Tax=Candidatus Avidehalobacter gallistercoris TaxID=2840694 RepID=A0A9D1HLX2_9FIRM|nr:hypothetical protein [Candidatus Avidehalobacter gallistercoris]